MSCRHASGRGGPVARRKRDAAFLQARDTAKQLVRVWKFTESSCLNDIGHYNVMKKQYEF